MDKKKNSRIERLKDSLLDREKYLKTVRQGTYIILFFVAVLMTALNIFTLDDGVRDLLTITTASFSGLALLCFLINLIGGKASKFASILFSIGLILMFTIFLVSGKPDGFSAIWIALVPIASMVFFGRWIGSILSFIMFVILVLFFWVKVYKYVPSIIPDHIKELEHQYVDFYGQTFMTRFPILYLSFYAVTFLLETIQEFQFDVLDKVNGKNLKYSTHDQLTGLYNRKGFYEHLEKIVTTQSYDKIGFIIFDLDFFKKLNDTYGHLAGDEVLIEFANIIKDKLNDPIACRWGGEEFLVCYFGDEISKTTLEEFRAEVENHKFISENNVLKTTVSGGVFETNDKNYSNNGIWLKNADTALYKAKETGRNKIIYF